VCQFWVTHRLQDVPRIHDPSHLVTQRRNERRIGASRLSRQYRPEFELHRRYNSSTYTEDILKSAVRLGQDFQEALPLLPAVVRGPDGLIRIKGGRTDQTSTLVNTASVADPFTRQPALRLPVVAVQSVRLLSNPFSSEYRKFSSGVVEVKHPRWD